MSTDRELLELAAKAAGINAEWHNPDSADYDAEHEGLWLKGARTPDNKAYWNPLTDDGDALRLAVKLSIDVYTQDGDGKVGALDPECNETWEPVGADPYAAMRRAIVRAAAAIGEAMS